MSEENNQVNPIDTLVKSVIDGGVKIEMERLQSNLEAEQVRARGYRDEIFKLRSVVHDFFSERFDGGEEETNVNRDDVNELLGDIGADLLQQEYEGRVTVSFSFTVKAESEDEAREIVENAVSGLENQIDAGNDDSYSEESIEVEF